MLAPSPKNNRDGTESKRAESSTNLKYSIPNTPMLAFLNECIHIFRSQQLKWNTEDSRCKTAIKEYFE